MLIDPMFPMAMFLRPKRQQQQLATVTIVLVLSTLGGTTQIGTFLLAKVSKEGDIASQYRWHCRVQTSPMYMSL
jgi:hypothetical protein